jgi:UDP-N-acetylglucosamine 2-epimerase (non-hydrolysing)
MRENPRLRVLVVAGTRPEMIKMAPVLRALAARPDWVEAKLCVTGQHRQMLDQVLGLFDLRPDIDLDLMQDGQTPSQLASRALAALEPVLSSTQPDWILVQGDTTTVAAAAFCAHYSRVRVGHVEAGLRSYDRANPFPEEANRVLADHLSDLNFAPTPQARDNLLREGIADKQIQVTGNTVIDALLHVAGQQWAPEPDDPLSGLAPEKRTILVTAHRRESFGKPLSRICDALEALAGRGDTQIVYPVHLNPEVHGPVRRRLGGIPGILLLPPVDYRRLVYLMRRSYLILTDSGGIQEEAPSLGVPVLVLRNATERPEGVAAGAALVIGTDAGRIVSETCRLLDDAVSHRKMARAGNPYGDGRAAERIVDALLADQTLGGAF